MKTVKQYIENCIGDHIRNYTNESLLNDEDVLLDPERDKAVIENWIKENYVIKGTLKISDDFTVSCKGSIVVENKDITSLTNGMFSWGEIGGEFSCCNCENLKSLKGAPKGVDGDFSCYNCKNLKSLEGAPERVKGWFGCSRCERLKSLEGAPETVVGDFYCYRCPNLVITDSDRKKYNIKS